MCILVIYMTLTIYTLYTLFRISVYLSLVLVYIQLFICYSSYYIKYNIITTINYSNISLS